jgi:hypothetical protein
MINERSKADGVTKAIAIWQTSWFAITIIIRLCKRMPLSLLEVLTISYVFCGLIIFICLFERPRDVQFHIEIERSLDWPAEIRDYNGCNDMSDPHFLVIYWVFTFVFCAIHIAAWDYDFPTILESWLWRSFSIALFAISVLIYTLYLYRHSINGRFWGTLRAFLAALYEPVRVYLIAESFLAFRSADPAIYTKVGWSSYWGHVGS